MIHMILKKLVSGIRSRKDASEPWEVFQGRPSHMLRTTLKNPWPSLQSPAGDLATQTLKLFTPSELTVPQRLVGGRDWVFRPGAGRPAGETQLAIRVVSKVVSAHCHTRSSMAAFLLQLQS